MNPAQLSHTEELVDRSGLISYSGTLPAAQFLQAQPFRADSLVRRVCVRPAVLKYHYETHLCRGAGAGGSVVCGSPGARRRKLDATQLRLSPGRFRRRNHPAPPARTAAGLQVQGIAATDPAAGSERVHQRRAAVIVHVRSGRGRRVRLEMFSPAAAWRRAREDRTSVQLDKFALGRANYWRARAQDGANTGPFAAAAFEVLPRPVLNAPAALSPGNNERIGAPPADAPGSQLRAQRRRRRAGLRVQRRQGPGLHAGRMARDAARGAAKPCGRPTPTSITDMTYWRGRTTDGETTSSWRAETQVFRSPLALRRRRRRRRRGTAAGKDLREEQRPGDRPPAFPRNIRNGSQPGCGPRRSASANMEFLRDRIIESGKCGGLDLGWNLKRGGDGDQHRLPGPAPFGWRDGGRPRPGLRQHVNTAAAALGRGGVWRHLQGLSEHSSCQ